MIIIKQRTHIGDGVASCFNERGYIYIYKQIIMYIFMTLLEYTLANYLIKQSNNADREREKIYLPHN